MLFPSRKDGTMQPYDEQPLLAFPTDTVVPVSPIPIFYLHDGEHPFCRNPACLCHRHDGKLKNLLLGVIKRKLKLVEVAQGAISWEGK
jgi:hypothetical protein